MRTPVLRCPLCQTLVLKLPVYVLPYTAERAGLPRTSIALCSQKCARAGQKLARTREVSSVSTENPWDKRHREEMDQRRAFRKTKEYREQLKQRKLEAQRLGDEETRLRGLAEDIISAGYRQVAARHHPDRGGTADRFIEIGALRDIMRERLMLDRPPKRDWRPWSTWVRVHKFHM